MPKRVGMAILIADKIDLKKKKTTYNKKKKTTYNKRQTSDRQKRANSSRKYKKYKYMCTQHHRT